MHGADRHDDVVDQPDLAAVEAAIRRLDGQRTSEVCIDAEDDSYFVLGGGRGYFVGFAGRSDEEIYDMVNLAGSPDHKIEICASGQTGYYNERQLVDQSTAIRSACTFAESGLLDDSIHWERE